MMLLCAALLLVVGGISFRILMGGPDIPTDLKKQPVSPDAVQSDVSEDMGDYPSVAYNDTGASFCTNVAGAVGDCTSVGLGDLYGLGQDGEVGVNAGAKANTPFSFTKIDASGRPLPDDAPEWSCVLDNTTGLLWEHKNGKGLHGNAIFSWYNPDPKTNGGNPGFRTPASAALADNRPADEVEVYKQACFFIKLSECNTMAFQEAVNQEKYCGRSDWRLPDIDELTDLGDFNVEGPEDSSRELDLFFGLHAEFGVHSRTSVVQSKAESSVNNFGELWTVSGITHEERRVEKTELLPARLVSDLTRKAVTRQGASK